MDTLDSYQTPSQDWYNDTWLSSLHSDCSSVEGAEGAEGSQSRMQSPSPATPALCQRERSLSVAAMRTNSRLRTHAVLSFLSVAHWNGEAIDDSSRPSYIYYSIEWKLSLNGRVTAKDTEPDVVLSPSDFWEVSLRKKLEELLKKKQASKSLQPDETNVVVSVTDRHERDLVKRFDERNVDWTVVEKQLRTWSHLLRLGKRLRVNISFRYLAVTQAAEHSPWPGHTRGIRSATQAMLAQRELQLNAEQDSLGQPSI
ncbi:hypothetical protein F4677DRAFT_425854 [Hypoxylon crocopeplum]|nr:hypothetical protein F4677DRAFT_425854 [Hypoxylon crocopeplum]